MNKLFILLSIFSASMSYATPKAILFFDMSGANAIAMFSDTDPQTPLNALCDRVVGEVDGDITRFKLSSGALVMACSKRLNAEGVVVHNYTVGVSSGSETGSEAEVSADSDLSYAKINLSGAYAAEVEKIFLPEFSITADGISLKMMSKDGIASLEISK